MAQAIKTTGAENVHWDLTELYGSPTDPEIEATLKGGLEDAQAFEADYKGRLATLAPAEFAAMMEHLEDLQDRVARPSIYASLLHTQDTASPANGRLLARVEEAGAERGRHLVFFHLELADLTDEQVAPLYADPRASLLVVEETPAGADPLASGRVTLLGTVAEVVDPQERAAARAGYLGANPAAFYVDYGDFRCLRLVVTDVRYVGGFGRMSWLDVQAYAAAQPDPLMPAAPGIIRHMNADHAEALVTLCHHYAGRDDVISASMTAVDRYGYEVVADLGADRREALRIGFRAEQVTADGVRREFIGMLQQARR